MPRQGQPESDTRKEEEAKAAGEALPPSKLLTGPRTHDIVSRVPPAGARSARRLAALTRLQTHSSGEPIRGTTAGKITPGFFPGMFYPRATSPPRHRDSEVCLRRKRQPARRISRLVASGRRKQRRVHRVRHPGRQHLIANRRGTRTNQGNPRKKKRPVSPNHHEGRSPARPRLGARTAGRLGSSHSLQERPTRSRTGRLGSTGKAAVGGGCLFGGRTGRTGRGAIWRAE